MEKKKMDEPGMSRRSFLKISAALGAAASMVGLPTLSAEAEAKAKKAAMAPFKQGMINTALGPMSPDKLGTTLMHEHFAFGYPGWYADATIAPYDLQEFLKTNLKEIKIAQSYGIKTIVDATPNDCGGRDPELYKLLAKKTGLNIICSTGLYTDHEGAPAYFQTRAWTGQDIPKLMADIFVKEITEGIGKSGMKAGVIKVATSPKMTPHETNVHKAGVVAQMATGVPIITHTEGPLPGVDQADFLLKQGADPKKVMIGHVSNSKEIEYHKAILAKGVYIAFDRIGLDIITPMAVNVKNIADLCKLGFTEKIMLSHDTVNWVGRPPVWPEQVKAGFVNWHIAHISKDVVPALKAEGITDEQIKVMMVDNPKRLFLGV
jgi:phosphotriesterase-related protein